MIGFTCSFPVTHVLHIGAGTGSDLDGYLSAGLDPIVLVEADPDAAKALQRRTEGSMAGSAKVRVIAAAVTARQGAALYHKCNFSDLNALLEPNGALQALYPGLQILAREPVEALSPQALMQGCDCPEDGAGLLVIEAPGEALGILGALQEAGELSRFAVLRLQEGRDVLYPDAPGLDGLQSELQGFGYDSWVEASPADPDRPYLLARRNVAALMARQEAQVQFETQSQKQAELLQRQALLEADLRDLQLRYGALLRDKEVQEDLLRRLNARLAPLFLADTEGAEGPKDTGDTGGKQSQPGQAAQQTAAAPSVTPERQK